MWLTNLHIILPDGEIECGAIRVAGTTITAILAGDCPAASGETVLDCGGLTALPGLIDLFGDLLEREREPRPGSLFPLDAALHEFDKRIAGAGITIEYAALTLDAPEAHWRSRRPEHVQAIATLLTEDRDEPLSELHAHIRVTANAPDATASVLVLIADAQCGMIGFRGLCAESHIIAEAARNYAIPLVLHEPADATEIARAHSLGIQLCFQPRTLALLHSARACGMRVAISAPDLVRGSILPGGAVAVAAVRDNLVDFLISDESPIALLQACFTLTRNMGIPLYRAVALVSQQPADLLGFHKRGRLTVGSIADILLVEPGMRPRVRATMRAGEFVYRRGEISTLRGQYVAH
jgi:alpha-D-ribose 1-methylphosphonate 5-triphosphate diphosphatase